MVNAPLAAPRTRWSWIPSFAIFLTAVIGQMAGPARAAQGALEQHPVRRDRLPAIVVPIKLLYSVEIEQFYRSAQRVRVSAVAPFDRELL